MYSVVLRRNRLRRVSPMKWIVGWLGEILANTGWGIPRKRRCNWQEKSPNGANKENQGIFRSLVSAIVDLVVVGIPNVRQISFILSETAVDEREQSKHAGTTTTCGSTATGVHGSSMDTDGGCAGVGGEAGEGEGCFGGDCGWGCEVGGRA